MTNYTVRQLAQLAGVTVRALHHYDQIGLLTPAARNAADYRLYGQQELLRLQQILFYRELDLSLHEIKEVLDDPRFDPVQALQRHKHSLEGRAQRLAILINTVDRTIQHLEEQNMPLTDKDLYEGFDKETAERYQREAEERYDPALVQESQQRLRKLSKEQWNAVKAEGDEITRSLAAMIAQYPTDAAVQANIARHYAWIEHFYTPTAEVYAGLGQLYVENDEFRTHYEQYAPGLADFMCAAMAYYAEHNL